MFELSDLAGVAEQNDEASVRAEVLDTNYLTCSVSEAALRVAKLLLLREPSWDQPEVDLPNVHDTAIERLVDRLKADGLHYRAVMLSNWATARQGWLPLYALFLYNADYRRTRAILEHILTGEKWSPPYLKLVLLNILHQSVGLGHDELHRLTAGPFHELAPWVNRIFHDDAVFDWLRNKKKKPIRFYGGVTNTVIGLYDDIFADPATGAQHIDRTAECCIDVGGGFNTSEIERLVGRPFISADLMTPRLADYDEELLMFDLRASEVGPVATQAVRQEFLARQDRVEHLPFDVFEQHFPTDARSYTIVSTGFMTSTLRPTETQGQAVKSARLGTISTSVHAILRVMELVALGKSVDLFTIQRATSRVYHYKTCLLQWREGKVARLVTTVDPRSANWSGKFRYAAMQPDNPRFRRLMELPLPSATATDVNG